MKRVVFFCGWIALLSTFCCACEVKTIKEAGYDVEAIREEMELRKVKRITPAEFVSWVDEHGSEAVVALNRYLGTCLQQTTFAACKQQMRPYADSLARVHGFRYEYLDSQDLQEKVRAAKSEQEKQLWTAYLYALEQDNDLHTNVQFMKARREYWYTAPFVLYEEFREKSQAKEVVSGLWLLRFPQKEIVKRFK
ncbi:MAG: hypothetical protein KatS3mg033_1225 [Thermonema sp.]|uniref:hypothetical protein n=1 Tax=Thermonema TaxID=28194 RepID=UPI00056F5A03|nr:MULTISPECIES: hypothetical protein [Thermonema]GIV39425.1 MAG: hypothetical protein KatS3mg033_1225 [Thermonema sp.]